MSDSEESSIDHTPDSDSDDSSDPQKEIIREELKNMPFEDLLKLKEKLGAKVSILGIKRKTETVEKKEFKRENKNRPREMSFRKPIESKKKKKSSTGPRDPRFDEKCGEFSRSEFKKRYSFVEDMRKNELTELRTNLKETKDPEEKMKLKRVIQRLDNQLKESSKQKDREESRNAVVQEMQEAKDPIYTNKKQQKLRELVKQFKDLKETGKLKKHIEKRRKKNASRDRKKINRVN